MTITATKPKRKVIRHRVVCGVQGCHTTIGFHVFKVNGGARFKDGYVFEPNSNHAGGKQVICLDHAAKDR